MILFLICILVGYVLVFLVSFVDLGVPAGLAMGILGAGVGALIGLFVSLLVLMMSPSHDEKAEVRTLAAINDGNEISGSFFLIAGSVGEDSVYRFYSQGKDGHYKLEKVYADDAEIVETNSSVPRVVSYDRVTNWHWADLFNMGRMWDKDVIYVPKGSIKRSFVLDAK